MFTKWMQMNQFSTKARTLTYIEFPQHFVWNKEKKEWTKRKRGHSIGRLPYVHPSTDDRYYFRMLLNLVRGPTSYEQIRFVNGVQHPTYKSACNAMGLLMEDNEWNEAIAEASNWATPSQLRDLYVTMLMFCEVNDPLQLLKHNEDFMSEDILYSQRKIFGDDRLEISKEQSFNYMLLEIEKMLNGYEKTLTEYDIPVPDGSIINDAKNRLIMEERMYNTDDLKAEHDILFEKMNEEQLSVYHTVIKSVHHNAGGFYFLYGYGGTGKTFVYRAIITKLRSEGKIVLPVASSGIASLLLPGGRTAHSRFEIPVDLLENATCRISQGGQLAKLIQQTDLIIWDEAPMDHKYCFEAVDRSLKDIMGAIDPNNANKPFGGITMLLGGDFRQILSVVVKGTRQDIVAASLNKSELWDSCTVLTLTRNMRIFSKTQDNENSVRRIFANWVLKIGDGNEKDTVNERGEDNWIEIPHQHILHGGENPIDTIVQMTYPNFTKIANQADYLKDRAILAPKNVTADAINEYMMNLMPASMEIFHSTDTISKSSDDIKDQELLYPPEFLNSLKFSGIPNHELKLKKGVPVMLLRNLNPGNGLCNGTRLIVTNTGKFVIEGMIITGNKVGEKVIIPRIILSASDTKWPFILKRRQFPLKVSYAMTINKSQGQTLNTVGVFLKEPVFCHGQLYVAISRVTSPHGLKILLQDNEATTTKNVVFKEVFNNLPKVAYNG